MSKHIFLVRFFTILLGTFVLFYKTFLEQFLFLRLECLSILVSYMKSNLGKNT
jgi:hypothetical protein